MPQQLQTTAFVLARRISGSDSFESLSLFGIEHGVLLSQMRRPKASSSTTSARRSSAPRSEGWLDLFDEAEFWLESSNQGRTWFIKEHRLLHRHAGPGRSYDSLRCASALAALLLRNPVPDESREPLAALLRQTFAALAAHDRADIVWLKTLFCFLRDEGYPVKQHWWPHLPPDLRDPAAQLLNQPLAAQSAGAATVARLTRHLEDWLQAETEIKL